MKTSDGNELLVRRRPVLAKLSDIVEASYRDPYVRTVRPKFSAPPYLDFARPHDPTDVLEHVVTSLEAGMLHVSNPGYFGYFNPAPTFMSVVADALVAVYNPQLGATAHAPVAVDLENRTLTFVGSQLGFADGDGIFTSGEAESNQTARLCALRRKWTGWKASGVHGRRPRLYASEQAHHSLLRAVRIAGLGTKPYISSRPMVS